MEDLPVFYSWAVSAASSPPASQNRKKNLVTYQRNVPTSSQSNDATSRMRSVVRSSRIGQSRNRPVKRKGDEQCRCRYGVGETTGQIRTGLQKKASPNDRNVNTSRQEALATKL